MVALDEQEQLELAKARLDRIVAARTDFLEYAQFMMPDPEAPDDARKSQYVVKPHHEVIAEALQRVADGTLKRVALSIPPQHGKSLLASRLFPAWFMGRFPKKNLIFGTYNETFGRDFGGDVREIMDSPQHHAVFEGSGFREGSASKQELVTNQGGKMLFTGRGGSATGKPCDLFIIDDPLKNDEEAQSSAIREQLHNWYSKVVYSRARKNTAIVIVHTRWHEDDLIGRLCDPDHPDHDPDVAAEWTYINIPAVVKDGPLADALGLDLQVPENTLARAEFGTEPMAALWDEEFDLPHLASASRLDPRGFSALYMGNPTPADGEYFRAENFVAYRKHELPPNLRYYGASDHAVSTKQGADFTVLGCVGICEKGDVWIMPDLVWRRMQTDVTIGEMIMQMRKYKPLVWWMESELISKSFGPFLIRQMQEERVYTPIDPVTPSKDKPTRARAIQGRMQLRTVHFPVDAHWWADARSQMLRFPHGRHDDFVDWLSWIGLGMMKETSPVPFVAPPANDDSTVGSIQWILRQSLRQAAANARPANGGW